MDNLGDFLMSQNIKATKASAAEQTTLVLQMCAGQLEDAAAILDKLGDYAAAQAKRSCARIARTHLQALISIGA